MTHSEALTAPYNGASLAKALARANEADHAYVLAVRRAGYWSRWDMPPRAHHALPEYIAKVAADRQLGLAIDAEKERQK